MQIMITQDIIKESYIKRIVARDSKIIYDTQDRVVSENLNVRSGRLSEFIKKRHFKEEGTHFQFLVLNYLRFLDIKNRKDKLGLRRDFSVYNKVIWGVLYHETLPALRYGFTEDIKRAIHRQLVENTDTQQSIQF